MHGGQPVIVQRGVQQELVERLVARAGGMRLGDGLDERVQMGPIVSRGQLQTISGYVEIGKQEGARLATGGSVATEGALGKGFFHEPTIFDNVGRSMRIANEEIFGPVTSIVPVDSLDEAIDIANSVEYGLSASIFTQDINNAYRAKARHLHRHSLCERGDDRSGDSSPVRWHQGDR